MDATANVTGSVIAATPENMMGIIWLYVLIIALVAFLPRFVEIIIIYIHQRRTREQLIEKTTAQIMTIATKSIEGAAGGTQGKPEEQAGKEKAGDEQAGKEKAGDEQGGKEKAGEILDKLKGLLTEIMKEPLGTPGTFRLTIAVTIILIVGIAIFHLLVFGQVSVSSIASIISALIAIIGTIAGFYFGGRASETAKEKAGEQKQGQGQPPK